MSLSGVTSAPRGGCCDPPGGAHGPPARAPSVCQVQLPGRGCCARNLPDAPGWDGALCFCSALTPVTGVLRSAHGSYSCPEVSAASRRPASLSRPPCRASAAGRRAPHHRFQVGSQTRPFPRWPAPHCHPACRCGLASRPASSPRSVRPSGGPRARRPGRWAVRGEPRLRLRWWASAALSSLRAPCGV